MTRDEVDEQLATAIHNHANAYELNPNDDLLDTFAIIASWQPLTGEGEHTYTLHYPTNCVPQHIAVGLFTLAADIASTPELGDEP